MNVTITYDPTIEDIRFIVNNLREDDVREISSANGSEDREIWTQEQFLNTGWKILFKVDGEPVAMYRFYSSYSGVWHAFLMATRRIEEIKLSLIRHGKKVIFPTLHEDMKARIIYTHSVAWRGQSKPWLAMWGAKKEHTLRGFGKNGEDVDIFCWRREELS